MMNPIEKRKQNINDLLSNYRPLGPRDLLAAALMLQAGKDAKAEEKIEEKPAGKAAA
ncbi:hypothetical protein JJB09_03975 [Rhizobium sp. KVB221]|uniref:Uncharacterized protein n=1 Tax=Rhizobium setariae TaxID=2801340 RepID=A0A936YLY9_9HYPH|nr:hypothetical protein [Rhizobium setariae]MBL0371177.1 hypothetical protein [Rhizobium setariae]